MSGVASDDVEMPGEVAGSVDRGQHSHQYESLDFEPDYSAPTSPAPEDDEPKPKPAAPIVQALSARLGLDGDVRRGPPITDQEREVSTEMALVVWRDQSQTSIFSVEPAICLDTYHKPLIGEFLTDVRDLIRYRDKWEASTDAAKIQRASKGQQRFGPGSFEAWTYTPTAIPPPYGQKARNRSAVELIFVIDRMIDWTRRACGLPRKFLDHHHENRRHCRIAHSGIECRARRV